VHPNKPVERFGKASAAWLRKRAGQGGHPRVRAGLAGRPVWTDVRLPSPRLRNRPQQARHRRGLCFQLPEVPAQPLG
jgi:hypothetical protein